LRIIPDLIRFTKAGEIARSGKQSIFEFRMENG
jgi:hypothetical protein